MFLANKEQISKIIANAVNASIPHGAGHFVYERKNYEPELFSDKENRGIISINYYGGRCVKLSIKKLDNGYYEFIGDYPDSEYQTWNHRYESYEELVKSVEGTVIKQ